MSIAFRGYTYNWTIPYFVPYDILKIRKLFAIETKAK